MAEIRNSSLLDMFLTTTEKGAFNTGKPMESELVLLELLKKSRFFQREKITILKRFLKFPRIQDNLKNIRLQRNLKEFTVSFKEKKT